MGAVRALLSRSSRLSRAGATRVGRRARFCRKSVHSRLGWVCRQAGSQHRHGDLWRLGATQGIAEEVWLHTRERRRGSEAADRESEVNDAHRDRFRSCGIRAEGTWALSARFVAAGMPDSRGNSGAKTDVIAGLIVIV